MQRVLGEHISCISSRHAASWPQVTAAAAAAAAPAADGIIGQAAVCLLGHLSESEFTSVQ
jgi:hypothetical protein